MIREIDQIAGIGARLAGSDAERRTARQLSERLSEMGREVDTEPLRVRASFGLTHLIHAVLGVVGSVLAVYMPTLGFAIVALAALSAFGEISGAFALFRLLTPSRASQNVISDEDNEKPGLIVLVAHYDVPRGGMLSENRRLHRLWPSALFWSLVVILVCAALRILGLDATWLTLIQFLATVVLIALSPLFVDWALSAAREGAADNAAGVATVLRLAERFGGRLEHFDLMALFTGASAEAALGMRDWLGAHRKELDREATAVVSIDRIAAGEPRFAEKEGPVFRSRLHPTLIDLCDEDAEGFVSRELSDAAAARAAGLPALRISCGEERGAETDQVDPDACTRTYEFAAALIERIDGEIGPRLA